MSENNVVPVRQIIDLPVVQNDTTESMLASIQNKIQGPSGDKIRVTQFKKFRLPSGEETDGPLEGVIVDFVSANVFYKDGFDKDNMGPPDCFAINPEPNLLVPSPNSPDRQAESCAVCPNNQFGTGARGKGKACKNTRVLAFMPADATQETPPWILNVSPTGIKGFDDYVRGLAGKKISPLQIVTAVGFDKSVDFPSLKMAAVRPLTADEFSVFEGKLAEARTRLLVEPDTTKRPEVPKSAGRGRR